jgi:toxin ParE1/3/4
MAFQVLVTEIANEDLGALVRFIARDNPEAAERFGLSILGKLKLLEEHPRMGRVVPELADPGVREIIHSPYRVIYRIVEGRRVIEVLRVWHGARGEPKLNP